MALLSGWGVDRHAEGEQGHPAWGFDPAHGWSGDYPITARCRTFTVVAALCPGADRKPGVGGRLCRCHAGGAAAGRLAARRAARAPRRAVPAVYPDLEFGVAQRQCRSRVLADAAGAPPLQYHPAAAPG